MKYIRFQRGPIAIFSDDLVHSEVARGVGFSSAGPPASAGFVVRDEEGRLSCTGRSTSLGLSAGEADDVLIQEFLKSIPETP